MPTISLMEDHCHSLQKKGVSAAYLGSAQPDNSSPENFIKLQSGLQSQITSLV